MVVPEIGTTERATVLPWVKLAWQTTTSFALAIVQSRPGGSLVRLPYGPDAPLPVERITTVRFTWFVPVSHAIGCGDVRQTSTPCRVTFTLGVPVEVVNVQLPLLPPPTPSRLAVMTAVVEPSAPVTPGPDAMPIDASPVQFPSTSIGQVTLLVVFFMLGYTFYAALFAAIGAMVNTEQEAQQAQLPVVMLLILSIMFLQPVLNAPDGKLANTLTWLPFSSPIVMPLRMSAVTVPAWEIAASIFALMAGCYIAVWLAARIYRTGLLMYGKRPSIGEVARWVRQG